MSLLGRMDLTIAVLAALAFSLRAPAQVFPGTKWAFKPPAELGMSGSKLDTFKDYLGGRGCVVRHGYMVFTWGDQSHRQDVASAAKPCYSHFLFKAVEQGRLSDLDEKVVNWESGLAALNPGLGFKDRDITFRHLATQTSCYGVREKPGAAFDYNDYQMALFWDTLFLKVYRATYENVDGTILHALLTDPLQCEDAPTFSVLADRPGRLSISVRDFARFGLLYLRKGDWKGVQLLSREHATLAVSSPLPNSIPRTTAVPAEMCPGQRTMGGKTIPDDQTDHLGSYSYLWWVNGVDRDGRRHWPDVPADTFGAFGHANGKRALVVIPSLDLVASWNDTTLDRKPGNPVNQALRLLADSVLPAPGPATRYTGSTKDSSS